MKKSTWQLFEPGKASGLLVGMTIISGLALMLSSTETSRVLGFFMGLCLLSDALGKPLAGTITSMKCLFFVVLFDAPDMKAGILCKQKALSFGE